MSVEGQSDPRRLNKRDFLRIGLGLGGTLLLAGCSRGSEALPTVVSVVPIAEGKVKGPVYLIEQADGSLSDGRIDFLQHPFVSAVRFSFDPNRAGGSLVMDTTFRRDSESRIVTEETDRRSPQNPGLIYAMSTREKTGLVRKYPVIRFAPLEEYLISLGFKLPGEDCLKTFQDMLTYYLTRDNNGKLEGRFEGLRTFNPSSSNFKPRDDEAKLYFDKSCLS